MPQPSDQPIIREATPEDAAIAAEYMRKLRAEVKAGLNTIPWRPPLTDDEERAYLEKMKANPHACIFIAVHEGELVGMINIEGGELPHDRHAGWLGISVAPHWRGRGLGRKLMQRSIAEAQSWPEFCRIELTCTPWNISGIGLYESLGFVHEGVKRKGANMRGKPEDELLMGLIW